MPCQLVAFFPNGCSPILLKYSPVHHIPQPCYIIGKNIPVPFSGLGSSEHIINWPPLAQPWQPGGTTGGQYPWPRPSKQVKVSWVSYGRMSVSSSRWLQWFTSVSQETRLGRMVELCLTWACHPHFRWQFNLK